MDRRETIRAIAAAAVLPALGMRPFTPGEWLALVERAPQVLTERQRATINAAAQRIIPATHTPGAGDVHVEQFVDLMLADWYTPAERDRLLAGLPALDGFSDARPERQSAILESLDAEAQGKPEHWFAMLKYLVIWGYYTSQPAQTGELGLWPLPWHYDGCAPYTV
jgi:gluconate 2-dehydrogenase gamma chain